MGFLRDDLRLLHVVGPDARTFLGGLITQRTDLAVGEGAYGALLTPQGKWLVDFPILSVAPDALVLALPARAFDETLKKLGLFKLRSAVTLQEGDAGQVLISQIGGPKLPYADSRHSEISHDLRPAGPVAESAAAFHAARAALGVPEGAWDLVPNKSTLLDNGLAGAIDWKKGCFMGQEVTARMRYRALLKRVLVPYQGRGRVGQTLLVEGKKIGEIRSTYDAYGFAYVMKSWVGRRVAEFQLGTPLGLTDLGL